jgi:KUP system potassium uptake protein
MNPTSKKITASTLLVTLGIIYGDIGTSPLYVLKALVGNKPITELLVYGGVSCVFWTLTFQTTFKYIYLTLKADNHGEGGIFSLFALIRRYTPYLVIPTMIGASALLADGIITPPISVSSAVEGLSNFHSMKNIPTVPIVIMILSGLFFFQRYGTRNVGIVFGPLMFLWFITIAALGLYALLQYPMILKALNPYYAFKFLTVYPGGFILLGAIFLATTGAEALYSDLGHCGRKNVRVTWGFVKFSLLLNYLGQAAWLMNQGEGTILSKSNPFFAMMPQWFLLPGVFIATSAAIIASQALISGSYTLINEAMNLNFWPRVTVRQPTDEKGQIYIPSINIALWVGCVFMVLYFKESSKMEAAYGLAITITMMITTVLLSFYLLYKLKWNKILVFAIISLFSLIEVSFFVANIHKFPEGGYMTIFVSAIFFFVMYSVYYGRRFTNKFTKYEDLGEYVPLITELSNDKNIPKFSSHIIYLTKANQRNQIEEKIIRSIFSKHPKRADHYWFLHLKRTNEPFTLEYDVTELVDDKIIKININIGFRIQPRTELFFKKIISDLIDNNEFKLKINDSAIMKYNTEPDFKFVVIEKFLSVENEFSLHWGIVLNSYLWLKKHSLNDQEAFGLDKSDVVVEQFSLVYQPVENLIIERMRR